VLRRGTRDEGGQGEEPRDQQGTAGSGSQGEGHHQDPPARSVGAQGTRARAVVLLSRVLSHAFLSVSLLATRVLLLLSLLLVAGKLRLIASLFSPPKGPVSPARAQ
jgi:hypothetical protein